MTIDHERRSRLLGLSIRQQSWELEALREQNRMEQEALAKAIESVNAITSNIDQTEMMLCQVMKGQLNIDLAAVQAARDYLANEYHLRKLKLPELQRVAQRADQAEQKLKQASLTIKALNQVKSGSDHEVERDLDKRLFEHNMELWLQRAEQGVES